jgi:selenocysteine lyase/cysteine desulfurase
MEYASNVLGLVSAQLRGVKVIVINNDAQGNFPLHELEAAITSQTKLIVVTHVPSTAGNVLPAAAIGEIARKHHITYLLDAAQSIGQIPLDVKAIGCDIMVTTGRKFLRGPRGTAFLYVKKDIQDKLQLSQMDGRTVTEMSQQDYTVRNDAKRFEWHEKNHAVVLGFQKAIAYALDIGVDKIWQRTQYIAAYTRDALRNIAGVTVHDQGDELCGIVTFSVDGNTAAQVRTALAAHNINVTIGFAKSTLYYMNRKQLESVVRASVHYYNTEEEIDKLCEVISSLLKA